MVSIYRNDFKTGLDIVLLNIDNSGQLISTITLARNIDFSDGLSGGTERINSKIYFRKYIYLKYKSGIQALDIPGSDPFERKFSLLLRIDKTGKIY